MSVAAMLNTCVLPFQQVSSDPYIHLTCRLYGAIRNIEGGSSDEKESIDIEK